MEVGRFYKSGLFIPWKAGCDTFAITSLPRMLCVTFWRLTGMLFKTCSVAAKIANHRLQGFLPMALARLSFEV